MSRQRRNRQSCIVQGDEFVLCIDIYFHIGCSLVSDVNDLRSHGHGFSELGQIVGSVVHKQEIFVGKGNITDNDVRSIIRNEGHHALVRKVVGGSGQHFQRVVW